MKKLLTFIFVLLFGAGFIFSQSIIINQPNGGESWVKGSSNNIIWNGSNLTNTVKITLWKNDLFIGLIIKGQPANGTYNWIVGNYQGGTAPVGSEYKIKIREQGGVAFQTQDASEEEFKIISQPVISVSSPLGGVTKLKGKVCNISWYSYKISSNKVLIKLNPSSGTLSQDLCVINGNADNKEGRNNYLWTISSQIPDGKYTISVEKKEGSIKGENREFSIAGSRKCDLAIMASEFCSGQLKVIIANNGDHYYGDITVFLIYDMFGKKRISVPVIIKENFILFTGKNLSLTVKNNLLRNAVLTCSMNYILMLVTDKDHKDQNGGNNQYNGVAYKNCKVRDCNKPDIWFERVWEKKKYRNSSLQAGKKVKILAELRKIGKINRSFTTRLVIYYHEKQFDPWTSVDEKRWFLSDFGNKKELSFTFIPAKRGYYVFEWVVDIHNYIDERDEKNNKKIGNEYIWEKR